MKNQERFSNVAAPAPGRFALNGRHGIALAGGGLLVAVVAILTVPAWSNNGASEDMANRAPSGAAGANPRVAATGIAPTPLMAKTPATRQATADSLYEDASLAAMCQDMQIPQEEKTTCAGVAGRSERELESMLRQASKGGNIAAKTYLLRRNADEASARLDGTDALDENQRAESLAQLKTSLAELRDMALASKDPNQLTQLSSLYLRNAGVLEEANLQAAALTIAAGLGKGRAPAEFDDIYATYSPEEAARIKQMADQLSDRLKGTTSKARELDKQQAAATFMADCHADKNGVNPCLSSPY